MEENSESHMETDVSSTTGDVPETQEVTGSDGNVEMIVIVEKMDDEPSADEETDEQPSPSYELINTGTNPDDKSAEKETQLPKTPVKSPAKSPAKPLVKLPVKSPIKSPPKSPAKSFVKSPAKSSNIEVEVTDAQSHLEEEHLVVIVQEEEEVQPADKTHQTESADSSMEPVSIPSEEKPTQVTQKTPKKEAQKSIQKSPCKDLQSLDSAEAKDSKQGLIDNTVLNGKILSNETSKINDTSNKTITNIDITIETSNDSHPETLSELSEKEHRSISRELKSLINSAKESKIISECTQLTSKTRKSRTALDTSSSSLNSSLVEPNKIHDTRRISDMSQKSNCSEKSDKVVLKRSMRSQNPEFVSKVKQFLNSVTGRGNKDSDDEEEERDKTELLEPVTRPTPPKLKKTEPAIQVTEKSNKLRSDAYCWRCHWVVEQNTNEKIHPPMQCTVCPRSFHFKCLTGSERNKINLEKNWVCPECMIVLQAESSESRSPAMKKISLGMLCDLLKHALERMMDLNGVEPFMQPVDRAAFPDYDKYVVHPMDLSLMKDNINEGLYGSTEAFIADAQWILHNSIIFNTLSHDIGSAVQSKLTAGARALVRSCRAEMGEIEACPECYAAAHARRPTWFTDVCSTPHILFWAKLKGFPYWPAKGMSVNSSGLVDVRFFGAHDRAWVPAKDCFLYSEKDPNNFRTKRQDIIDSMQEAEQHIRNISRKYGRFVYPPFKTQFDPSKMYEQLKMMIPTFEGEVRSLVKKASPAAKENSRSNSKSSKESFNDGDTSDNEDTTTARKMADGAEIVKMEDDDSVTLDKCVANSEKDVVADSPVVNKTKEDSQSSTSNISSRKRRQSTLEEAVITIIETSGSNSSASEKRMKLDDAEENKKSDEDVPSSSQADDKTPDVTPVEETTEASQSKVNETPPKTKDNDPNDADNDKQRVTPIRIALVTKEKRKTRNSSSSKDTTAKIITPSKDKDKEKDKTPLRPKSTRSEKGDKTPTTKNDKPEKSTPKGDKTPASKSTEKGEKPSTSKPEKVEKKNVTPSDKVSKEERSKVQKRRLSRSSRSTNSTGSTRSLDKAEKKSENSKEKRRASSSSGKEKDKDSDPDKSGMEKQMTSKSTPDLLSPKSVKDRLQFDDDTTLAVLARETSKSTVSNNSSGLPTISCVRSLSTTAQNSGVTVTKTTTNANTIDITEEATSDSSIFTPTSSENVTTMQDAVSKLQRLRNDPEPVVGRVGVRAFARMTSPEKQTTNDEVQVEIKAEPIDLDDPDRHMEKMDLMNAFRLRPVNPQNVPNPTMNLRDVRINKVVVTPLNARKTMPPLATKVPEIRPRAKKTFPQPKKPEEGRSELNSKNSMVYIPIQPPMTQAPVRLPRPQVAAAPTVTSVIRPPVSSVANNLVNTVTTPLMQPSSSPSSTSSVVSPCTTVSNVPTVHTVPLMTSVNGQWMFSFQPVMSVGALDATASPPMLNGITDRGSTSLPATSLPGGGAGPVLTASLLPGAAPAATPGPSITVLNNRTENSPGEPPRLHPRPAHCLQSPLDANTPIGSVPTPSTAGPVTAKINQNAVKLTDFFRTLLEDSIEKVDEPWSQLTSLRLQLEQETWRHQQELKEIKHNHDLTLAEMRASFDKEKHRAVSEARRTAQVELEAAVKLAKSKPWCANCGQEAQYYCCWNTAYCELTCQRAHWNTHSAFCQQRTQKDSNGDAPSSPEHRLQPHPDLPKNTPVPTLTVGGKVAPQRPYNADPHSAQKTSIIVSMVEDTSGNQTVKCVGTYKPNTPNQMQPIIINKQLMNNEENVNANKKVVSSSGGYLIVGAPNNSTVVTPARRTHTIQYYT